MIVLEFKLKGKQYQYSAIDEAIRTSQFVQNKCLRYWMDNRGAGKYDLNKHCAVLAKEFAFANELNSQARQSAAERNWEATVVFTITVKSKYQEEKGIQSSRNIAVQLSIRRLVGSC